MDAVVADRVESRPFDAAIIAVGSELRMMLDGAKAVTDALGLGKAAGDMVKY